MNSTNNKFSNGVAIAFCLIVFCLTIMNIKLTTNEITSVFDKEKTFQEMTQELSSDYSSSKLWGRNSFINLNGLFMRLTGRRSVNEVTLLKNGMLTGNTNSLLEEAKVSGLSTVLPMFSSVLKDKGIQFLFVQAPCKIDLDGEVLQDGLVNSYNNNSDNLLNSLNFSGVNTLDLRPDLAQNKSMIESYFYKTDHHWNSDGAMKGFQLILSKLKQLDTSIEDNGFTDSSSWQRHEKKRWFLGSHGKRVGIFYGGVDSLIWYTPTFNTEISCLIPIHNYIYKGTYEDANIRSYYLEHKEYLNENPNAIYIGGSYPIVKYLNPNAHNQKRILLIKDSFSHSVQTFMSTIFSEVVSIDARYYTDSSILEYCIWNKPDIVIMMINAGQNNTSEHSKLGTDNIYIVSSKREQIIEKKNISITKGTGKYNNTVIYDRLKAGDVYHLSFDSILVNTGKTDAINITLINKTQNKAILNTMFDVEYSVAVGDTSWYFRVPDYVDDKDEIQLVIYAGIRGQTNGIGLDLIGLQLEKIK